MPQIHRVKQGKPEWPVQDFLGDEGLQGIKAVMQ
jgi:hypothetical protein